MADVLEMNESVQKKIHAQGIQIAKGLTGQLLTDNGKRGKVYLADFTESEQAKIKEVYGIVSAKLIKQVDSASSATASAIVTEVEKNIEAKPEEPAE